MNIRKSLFAALIILLTAGLFLLNAAVYQLSRRVPLSMDLTANAANAIGNDTRALLGRLTQTVNIYVMAKPAVFGANAYFLQVRRILEEYPQYSKYVTLAYVDYIADPNFALKFPDLSIQQGDILVVRGDRVKQLHFSEMFNYSYNRENNLEIVASRAEEALTSALLNVMSDKRLRAAVVTGNGIAPMQPFTDLLTTNNFDVSTVSLATDPIGGYDILLLFAPQTDMSQDDMKTISGFLSNGGQYGKFLMVTADASRPPAPNVNTFLNEWGVLIGDGAVFETDANRCYQNQPYYPIADYADTLFKGMLLDPSMPVLMPVSRPLGQLYRYKDNYAAEALLEFGASSGVRPSDAGSDFTKDKASKTGPMPAMILTSKTINGPDGMPKCKSSVLVCASNEMLNAFCIQNTSLSNAPYLLNIINRQFDVKAPADIQPKSLAGMKLTITAADAGRLGALLFIALPLGIAAAGVIVWLSRRYR